MMVDERRTSWRPAPVSDVPDGMILFDGVCVLCSFWVRFVIERDAAAFFRFAPMQSRYGTTLAERLGIAVNNPETNAVVLNGWSYFKSDAALAVVSRLPGWAWVRALRGVPRPLRDWCYDRIARSRYQIFGRTDRCLMPAPELAFRFVSDDPRTG